MRKIEALYRVDRSTLEMVDMEETSPLDLILLSTGADSHVGTTYVAVVQDMEHKKKIAVDLLLMMAITSLVEDAQIKLAACQDDWDPNTDILPDWGEITWDVLGECITGKLVAGYSRPLPEFEDGTRCLRYCQVLHTSDFECSYCLLDTPEDRNTKFRRWQLLDMAITKVNEKHPIQLENCLLSVNGCLSRPIMYKGELLMARGAEWIHNNTMNRLPSVTLIDFTNLGGITIVPFSDCKYKVKNGRGAGTENGPIVLGRDIEVILPEGIDLSNKHIWMVLGHSLFFEEKYVRVSTQNSVTLSPHLLSLDACLLKSEYHAAHYYQDTDVFSSGIAVDEYINSQMWDPKHHGAFFVLINTPHIYVRKTSTHQYAKERMHVAVPDTDGLLWDEYARSAVDHTRAAYRTYTDFYAMPQDRSVSGLTVQYAGIHEGVEDLHPWYLKWLAPQESLMSVLEVIRA